jgi:hypothetical protein
MKKQYLAVLFALICVFGLGLSARAQEQDTVVTNVPFDFLAGGRVLPGHLQGESCRFHLSIARAGDQQLRNACKRVRNPYGLR